jgi:hypothetical protein
LSQPSGTLAVKTTLPAYHDHGSSKIRVMISFISSPTSVQTARKIDITSRMTFTGLMDRQLVISSELHSVGYDDANRLLEVEFRTGGVYHYFGVPRQAYDALMTAASKGRFFNTQIKPAYPCMRVE